MENEFMQKISFRQYVQYYRKIISAGALETYHFYIDDLKNFIGNIVSGGIAILLLYFWGGTAAVFNPNLSIKAAFVGALAWGFIVLLWNIFVNSPI